LASPRPRLGLTSDSTKIRLATATPRLASSRLRLTSLRPRLDQASPSPKHRLDSTSSPPGLASHHLGHAFPRLGLAWSLSRHHLGLISASFRLRLGLTSPRINLTSKTKARSGFDLDGLGWLGWPGIGLGNRLAYTILTSPRPSLGLASASSRTCHVIPSASTLGSHTISSPRTRLASTSLQPRLSLASDSPRHFSTSNFVSPPLLSSRTSLVSAKTRPGLGITSAAPRLRLTSAPPRLGLASSPPRLGVASDTTRSRIASHRLGLASASP
jgi:hypothetical protein